MPRKFIHTLPDLLEKPIRPINIGDNAFWLSGEGAGSWFVVSQKKSSQLVVKRYNKSGVLECEKVYTDLSGFEISKDYSITYPSFCNKLTLLQGEERITLIE